jgi:hypothetical protein
MDEWDDASGVVRDGRRCAWVALECGNFGAHRPTAAFPARCERSSRFNFDSDAFIVDAFQNDCSSVVNIFRPWSTCL